MLFSRYKRHGGARRSRPAGAADTVHIRFRFGRQVVVDDVGDVVDIQAAGGDVLNSIIAENADNVGAKLADPYGLMGGSAAAWTNMLQGDIHPNPDGYQALAFSLAQAR